MFSPRTHQPADQQKEGKMCYILSLSIIGLVFFGDIVSNMSACKITFVEVLLCPEGPGYGHVDFASAGQVIVI